MPMDARILLADDEPAVREAVAFALRREGFEVESVADGEAALATARAQRFDLVILDVIMPGMSGTDVCRMLRAGSDIPVLLLSAKEGELDRVVGLELGADDYVTKPFSMAELVSRVRSILRRRELDRESSSTTALQIGGVTVDPARHLVEADGEPVHLTPSEFSVLTMLAEEPERVFTRRQIMERLWQSPYVGDERACDVHVAKLRRKLERDPSKPERIVTVRGLGYKLIPA
jgi:two-component system response regulator RegX3